MTYIVVSIITSTNNVSISVIDVVCSKYRNT